MDTACKMKRKPRERKELIRRRQRYETRIALLKGAENLQQTVESVGRRLVLGKKLKRQFRHEGAVCHGREIFRETAKPPLE